MLTGKRSATHRPLDRIRKQLEQRIRREAVTKAREEYLKDLRRKADIDIDNKIVAEIVTELSKDSKNRPSRMEGPPRPGR